MEINAILVSVYMLFTSIIILKKGYKPAKFFLIGWSIFLIGICIYVLKDFGFLPYNIFTRYTMHFGTAAEVILLSFALADRINILKQEKEQSQTEALLALQKNEKLIIEQNVVLENRVQERTIELKHTNEELNSTLSNLKDAQTQLVNVEKMASLGQLTAGIAHEINNPINFVSANIKPLKLDFIDILGLIKEYETITPETDLTIKLKDIENYKEQIDLTYLITEIESLISVIDDGAQRTIEIVAGLKNFSRLDESDIKIANINEGIRSTLILLKSAIPKNTTVITDLGNIPSIDCLPGKLNQVFMNLLSNAIYAITKKKTDDENKIIIKTYELNDHIYVSIEDTGIGMTDTVKAKVFDPFFTTKDVGEGTGLGMSIVYKIIESHQAKIEIESEFGVGTKMTLILNKRLNNY
jgi:two-component system NtrC family sensor kinase